MPKFNLKRLKDLLPRPGSVDRFERMRAAAGGLFGIVLTALCGHFLFGRAAADAIWLVAPMGASAVLLFAAPASPLAQPWSVVGGNVVSATVGVVCAKLTGDPVIGAALAVSMAIAAMFLLGCLHPPGGAAALTAVVGGHAVHSMGFGLVLIVAVNSLLLLSTAVFYNNATGRRYPHKKPAEHPVRHDTKVLEPTDRIGVTPADLDAVLARYNQVLDVSRDELESIIQQTEMQAYQRRFGETLCANVMSRNVFSVEFGTELEEAWQMLHQHRITALPVVDRARHVVGIVTKADFMLHAQLAVHHHQDIGSKIARLISRTRHTHSSKHEVVGQIMQRDVRLARADQPMVELVPMMSDAAIHQVPVIDADGRLVGMITQSDMIAALYKTNLGDLAAGNGAGERRAA